ncbi:hypothetical protein PR202_ga00445 [Eleusine coracana subsp. coracana]|uniref:Uncharacterized protein n=1 Tax=Eleusine coracana subsp. coracana TaxID=191504 RepID=A0AAV5BGI8_ELECO|nr:hypothetical protein PR202_ga00445 [Eleusine coracana subsp. coracana]
MTLVRFSPLPASALSSAVPGRRGFLLRAACPAHRLTAALAASNRVVLGCGLLTLDYLATVDAYPRPDDKIRTGGLQVRRSLAFDRGISVLRLTCHIRGWECGERIDGRGSSRTQHKTDFQGNINCLAYSYSVHHLQPKVLYIATSVLSDGKFR